MKKILLMGVIFVFWGAQFNCVDASSSDTEKSVLAEWSNTGYTESFPVHTRIQAVKEFFEKTLGFPKAQMQARVRSAGSIGVVKYDDYRLGADDSVGIEPIHTLVNNKKFQEAHSKAVLLQEAARRKNLELVVPARNVRDFPASEIGGVVPMQGEAQVRFGSSVRINSATGEEMSYSWYQKGNGPIEIRLDADAKTREEIMKNPVLFEVQFMKEIEQEFINQGF